MSETTITYGDNDSEFKVQYNSNWCNEGIGAHTHGWHDDWQCEIEIETVELMILINEKELIDYRLSDEGARNIKLRITDSNTPRPKYKYKTIENVSGAFEESIRQDLYEIETSKGR